MKNCLLLKLESRKKQLLLLGVLLIAANISAMAQRGSIELHLKGKTLLEVLTTLKIKPTINLYITTRR